MPASSDWWLVRRDSTRMAASRAVLRSVSARARACGQLGAQHFTLRLERDAAFLEFGHRVDGFLEPRRARRELPALAVSSAFSTSDNSTRELLHALVALLGAGAQAVELRAQAHVRGTGARDLRLVLRNAVLEFAHAAAQRFEVRLGRAVPRLLRFERDALGAQALLALEHAFVRVLVAADAQPVRTDPDAVARDDRLARAQLRSQRAAPRPGSRSRRCRRTTHRDRPVRARGHAACRPRGPRRPGLRRRHKT